jgi:hypothetical protein
MTANFVITISISIFTSVASVLKRKDSFLSDLADCAARKLVLSEIRKFSTVRLVTRWQRRYGLSSRPQAGSLLLGRGSLNQPSSESDLMRQRVSNNIGEASDEEISRMAITSRIVVTVSAETKNYVVFDETAKREPVSGQASRNSQSLNTNAEELR